MKKQVCMIAYTYYEYDNRVRREAEALSSLEEYAVTLFCLKKDAVPRTYMLNGVEVREINHAKYQGGSNLRYFSSYLKFALKAFFTCSSLFLKRKFDIIHIHNMPNFLVFSSLVPRIWGGKIILDLHDPVPEMYSTKFRGKLDKFVFKILCWEEIIACWFADKLICVNHVQMEKLLTKGIPKDKITVFLNVPDPTLFNQNGRIKINKGEHSHFKLVYHGTLAKRLGIDLIIQAVAKLIDKINGLELYIIGAGDDQNEFIDLSKQLSLEKHVHFLAPVPIEKLSEILKDMDLGVIANRKSEATELMLPVKLLEYIALRIPAVVPKLKAIKYYFNEDMVYYFEPDNIDSLAKAILEMQQDESRRLEQAQMAHKFLERFGWEKHKVDFINFYKKI